MKNQIPYSDFEQNESDFEKQKKHHHLRGEILQFSFFCFPIFLLECNHEVKTK